MFRPHNAVSHVFGWTPGEGYVVKFLSKVIVCEGNITFLCNSMNQKFTPVTIANNYSQILFSLQGFIYVHLFVSVTTWSLFEI